MINFFKNLFKNIGNDPVKKCPVYKEKGCAFVDNPLCDMEKCNILEEYKRNNSICPTCGYYCKCGNKS